MNEKAKILLASSDKSSKDLLKSSLSTDSYSIGVVEDGGRALGATVSSSPDLIILDRELKIISPYKLVEILRSNPKTEHIPIIFLVNSAQEVEAVLSVQDAYLIKPLKEDQLVSMVEAQVSKQKRFDQVGSDQEMKGTLAQISIVDLVQILSLNNKSGELIVNGEGGAGSIFVDSGAVINATIGKISGEKAFHRIMTWKTGSYTFAPGTPESPVVIKVKSDALLMESMRQSAETERLMEGFPDSDSGVAIRVDLSTLPKGLRPITQEVLLLLEFYSKISDIVDNCSFPDFEVYRTLNTLLVKGIIEQVRHDFRSTPSSKPLLTLDRVLELKEKLSARTERVISSDFGKVIILPGSRRLIEPFEKGLSKINGFIPIEGGIGGAQLGGLGEIKLSDSVQLDFISLPVDEIARPWWRIFSANAIGAICVIDQESAATPGGILESLKYFREELKLDVVFAFINSGEEVDDLAKQVTELLSLKSEETVFALNSEDPSTCDEIVRGLLLKVI